MDGAVAIVNKEEYKDVSFDLAASEGGGNSTRKRGRRGRRATAKHQSGGGDSEAPMIHKEGAVTVVETPKAVVAPAPTVVELAPVQGGGAVKKTAPVVVIAPAKKKPAKLMLVPKGKSGSKLALKKTFKAKRVCVTIDNTATTRKHRQAVIHRVESMTADQLRAAAVAARLSRRESVAKVPEALLRQMVRDYQTMKGMLL
jgi:hypothetical protein